MHCRRLRSHLICRPLLTTLLCGAAVACASVPSLPKRPEMRTEFWGFTAPWDSRSARSVTVHAARLDAVVSGWIALDSATFQPVTLFPDTFVTHTGADMETRPMTLVTSYHGTRFHPETVRGLSADSAVLAGAAGGIATIVKAQGYRGIILDLEGMTPTDLPALLTFTRAVTDSAHAHGIAPVALAIPATDTAAYPGRPLLQSVDCLVVMLYDQHWLTSPPGPIASPDWAQRVLGVRLAEVGPTKVVAAFPAYGYQWRSDSATAVLSYSDAVRLSASAHVPLERDPASMTLHAQAAGWTVWTSDAVLLERLVQDARRDGVTRFAIWRLGLEDAAVWTRVIP